MNGFKGGFAAGLETTPFGKNRAIRDKKWERRIYFLIWGFGPDTQKYILGKIERMVILARDNYGAPVLYAHRY